MKKLIVLSPHLDDAVLSCVEYCRYKQQLGWQVTVITPFTQFNPTHRAPRYSREYVYQSGFKQARWLSAIGSFAKARWHEDKVALEQLKWASLYGKLIDAGFRCDDQGSSLYPTQSALFSGSLTEYDQAVVLPQLTAFLKVHLKNADEVVVPWGIGAHADHLLTKFAVERLTASQNFKLSYYLEAPYLLYWSNWRWSDLKIFTHQLRVFGFSKLKRSAVAMYASQMAVLFPKKIRWYPEVILSELI